ncbi:MAG: CRISPR-associated protein Csm3 [Leptolyngbyaceae cyanobacterium SU_3_3]|nr:CRISPR-associated protein Csm3 [Leptolyngbyaceae cyanobacterium SU_3_3]NJR49874.1 CRISPR-associated protein Csm3 [Leptolyngbyaceae cyanobacterium CSU_1_3]
MIVLDELAPPILQTIDICAIVDSALCVGAGGSTGSLADKPIVRNAQGQLIIPGSQLKGRLRHECEKLAQSLGWWIAEAPGANQLCPDDVKAEFRSHYTVANYPGYHCLVSQIFGDPILPARIAIDDLVCQYSREELGEVIRPGVSINRSRGTAEDQKLFFLETSPANAQLPFKGTIHLLVDCPDYAIALISAALQHVHALGGSKSAGLGWLTWTQFPQVSSDDEIWSELIAPKGSE